MRRLILLTCLLTFAASQTVAAASLDVRGHGYRFVVEGAGWTVRKLQGGAAELALFGPSFHGDFPPSISVVAAPSRGLDPGRIISEFAASVASSQAHSVSEELPAAGAASPRAVVRIEDTVAWFRILCQERGEQAWLLICAASPQDFATQDATFRTAVDSFRLLQPATGARASFPNVGASVAFPEEWQVLPPNGVPDALAIAERKLTGAAEPLRFTIVAAELPLTRRTATPRDLAETVLTSYRAAGKGVVSPIRDLMLDALPAAAADITEPDRSYRIYFAINRNRALQFICTAPPRQMEAASADFERILDSLQFTP